MELLLYTKSKKSKEFVEDTFNLEYFPFVYLLLKNFLY